MGNTIGLYNEERKMEFISSYTDNENTKRICITLFKSIAGYENDWNADICTKQAEDLIPVIESFTGIRSLSKTRKVIILKKYIQWCIECKIPNATNGLKDVEDVLGLNKLRTQMVSSPAHLQKYMNDILHTEDMNTTDNTVRCFLWLAYGGMQELDIFNVKVGDVDLKRKIISLRHTKNKQYQTIPLSTELTHQLKEYMNLWLKGALPSDYLFPNVSGEAMTYSALHSSFCRYCKGRGIEQTNIHGLRHSFADMSLENGRNPFELQKILGHSTLDMTRKYIRLHEDTPSLNFDKQTPLDNLKKPTSHKRKIQRADT
jgi:integrase